MNKKFLSAILFGALMVTSTGTFVSCKDYDDDIDAINSELTTIKSTIAALQSKVDGGKYVTNVAKNGEGITVTWSDGTNSTIETIKGDKGDQGEKGAAVAVTIDPTTKNWLVDGVDTGVCAEGKNGENGVAAEAPIFSVGEDGHIYVQYGADAEKEDLGVSTGGIYFVEDGPVVKLHVCDEEGNWKDIVLPQTATITDLKAVTINDGKIGDAVVTLNYGKTMPDAEFKFNGVNYQKKTLLSAGSSLSAIVNPMDADATKYDFALVDSKGNAPYVISNVKANMTEKPLSRAATVNDGVWNMSVAYATGVDFTKAAARSAAAYALTTETYNGVVASAYDVKVVEQYVNKIEDVNLTTPLSKAVNESIDLTSCFKGEDIATVTVAGTEKDVDDLTPYIVDYYFAIADKTIAANYGIELNGNILTAKKNVSNVEIKVNYLLVDGTKCEGTTARTIKVNFTYVAPSNTLGDVVWTVNPESQVVYLPLGDVQTALIGSTDYELPTISNMGWTWTDGEALDSKEVKVNGFKFGKGGTEFAGNEDEWIAEIDEAKLYVLNSNGTYSAATSTTKIQTPLYIKFTFDYTEAFPGEYQVKLGLKKGANTSANNNYEIPVNVTIKSPAELDVTPFKRLDAYFVDDDAIAYGEANGTNVTYDLFSLYKEMTADEMDNVEFGEELHEIDNHTCAAWQVATHSSGIKVGVYNNAEGADNLDNVYSTREFKAVYKVYGNIHIPYVFDSFNLTIKSEIAEGTLTTGSAAAASGTGVEPIYVSLKNITAKDVYGKAYNLATTYKKASANATTYTEVDESVDSRLQSVEIVLVDDNAKEYLKVVDQNEGTTDIEFFTNNKADGYSSFAVMKKSATTALAKDVTCTVAIKVTDKWGKISSTNVEITLKK